jgi:hypothetical protein
MMIKMVVTCSATGLVGKPGAGTDGSTATGLGPRIGDPKGTYGVLSDEPSALHTVMLVGGTDAKTTRTQGGCPAFVKLEGICEIGGVTRLRVAGERCR